MPPRPTCTASRRRRACAPSRRGRADGDVANEMGAIQELAACALAASSARRPRATRRGRDGELIDAEEHEATASRCATGPGAARRRRSSACSRRRPRVNLGRAVRARRTSSYCQGMANKHAARASSTCCCRGSRPCSRRAVRAAAGYGPRASSAPPSPPSRPAAAAGGGGGGGGGAAPGSPRLPPIGGGGGAAAAVAPPPVWGDAEMRAQLSARAIAVPPPSRGRVGMAEALSHLRCRSRVSRRHARLAIYYYASG